MPGPGDRVDGLAAKVAELEKRCETFEQLIEQLTGERQRDAIVNAQESRQRAPAIDFVAAQRQRIQERVKRRKGNRR